MVHHGFQRPGGGYQTESCFGFGYEPFERSNLGTVKLLENITEILKKKEKLIPKMKEDTEIVLFDEKTLKLFKININDENFERENTRRINEVEREISSLKRDIKFYNNKLKEWKKVE